MKDRQAIGRRRAADLGFGQNSEARKRNVSASCIEFLGVGQSNMRLAAQDVHRVQDVISGQEWT